MEIGLEIGSAVAEIYEDELEGVSLKGPFWPTFRPSLTFIHIEAEFNFVFDIML